MIVSIGSFGLPFTEASDHSRVHGRATSASILLIKPTRLFYLLCLRLANEVTAIGSFSFCCCCDKPDPPHLRDRATTALSVQTLAWYAAAEYTSLHCCAHSSYSCNIVMYIQVRRKKTLV